MDDNSLAASVARSVAARGQDIRPEDEAVIDLAMRYGHQIDSGIAAGGQSATKALYLGPHLLKTLNELGCTPAARNPRAAETDDGGVAPEVANELAARRKRYRGRGA
ncbi:terminase small subunit [Corynebacterium phocae]|uniref:terminase small subunit n=1 Tax=Corynebacterium phocae TaxID=161895 RepID=UPI0009530274|nr:hypothetical protein [Corynebacterium phocae]KAA8723003.1 hypothetical protein F4V58_06635 [Corynebacterium phocae]